MDLHQFSKQLDENTRMTKEVRDLLIGRPEYKQPGMLDEIKDLKETVKRHDTVLIKIGGSATALGIVWGVVSHFIK